MNRIIIAGGAASALSVIIALFTLKIVEAKDRHASQIELVRQRAGITQITTKQSTKYFLGAVSFSGEMLARSGLLSAKTLADLQQTLVLAGFRSVSGLEMFVGAKMLLLFAIPFIGWFGLGRLGLPSILHNLATLACAVIGLLGPDFIVKRMRSAYLARLQKGLPDALDMMVICSEAGLGLEPSISRVAIEIAYTHPSVSMEFLQTASELRIISDRRLALQNMGSRTGLDGLKRMAATLIQTSQYGTPVSSALRTLSAEMRSEMLTQFEERAARLPVLLTVPMILFILPTVFAVVGGPAMLRVIAILHH